ncbi:ATPase associated with various cellular activities AAA_5 [Sulfolobus islandicus Y.G.57.14]|uniref:AAA+ ATPase n=11 Tax=Saccharolobus TaxID=2100760 RepID=A0A8F5GSV8_SACSH|nr:MULTISPECIES: AAA family ATPase [Sulfolobaceae]ACP34346.1 ATPase associated with various cellular activities AAA_5 [Sulfolobus islandicus L.S.2.15]ACP37051.1 ATPase associated with various cellular activities AAA_5 [Sulfolobus islandicus M.14.25]ACP44457.1 ATPase associated with various cellular activities AAA_5 [Sulfolobus islandicus Y.G.57.14]ACP54190.1 ATPase associated with various cellular activities AAA_5 [Sulfolobus islandicus M.16.27]ACR40813.1 ATPase associated with various cellula
MSEKTLLELPKKFMESLMAPFIGREEEAKVITLALLSKEHVILIGEPGTAKSALARRAAELLNAKFFMYLLTKYTEPAELFGALDINALKEGQYKRITKDRLPESQIAFLDEIFNANSAILNALLSLLNERVIYDGYNVIKVPLRTLISASNRVPDEPELEALYDRLLLRHYARPVGEELWKQLLDATWEIEFTNRWAVKEPIMNIEHLDKLYSYLSQVDLSGVKNKLLKLYAMLEEKGIHLSDRRKGKVLKVVSAHAILNSRLKATEEDLIVLKYIAPREIDDFEKVAALLSEELKTPIKYMKELNEIYNNIKEAAKYVEAANESDPRLIELIRSLRATRDRIVALGKESGDEKVEEFSKEVLSEIDKLIEKVARKLGIYP